MRVIYALLLASLLIGLSHVAALPPFEGIDETEHYSYIEQIAKTGVLPRFGDTLRRDIEDVVGALQAAPGPRTRSLRYQNLFTADAEIIKRVRQAVKQPRDPAPTGEPGNQRNWEVQHPPFYYALLVPAYLLSERWPLVGQLALLRGLSYLAAWLSLCLAVVVAIRRFPASAFGKAIITAPALWPFVFPGWFPEMARLGNDSLVALLVACVVAIVTCANMRAWSTWILLGVICGLGSLTKATFFPFLAGIGLVLLYQTWRRDASPWHFTGFLITVIAVAGWWYFRRAIETGMLFPTGDAMYLRENGGLIAALTQHLSLDEALAWAIPAAGMSFLWSGTMSFVIPPLTALSPLIVMLILISCAFLFECSNYRIYPLVQITIFTLIFWFPAIIYPTLLYLLVNMTSAGFGGFAFGGYGGYYLHSLAPALAPAIGIAITAVARNWLARALVWLLLGYNVAFLFVATFMQLLYFAGCGSNGSNRFNFAAASICWNDWQSLIDNLTVLAYPLTALSFAAGGLAALLWGVLTSLSPARMRVPEANWLRRFS
jgi:hypothetical protein